MLNHNFRSLFERLRARATAGKPFPDPDAAPAAWNTIWEQIALQYTLVINHSKTFQRDERLTPTPADDQWTLSFYRSLYHETCVLQHKLTLAAAEAYSTGFERRWKAAPEAVRQKHLLEGHVRTSVACVDADIYRLFCGDVTLPSLQIDSGKGFLRLVKVYLHDDLDAPPTTPKTYPYNKSIGPLFPQVELTDDNPMNAVRSIGRDMYVSCFLYATIQSFEGQPRPSKTTAGKSSIKPGSTSGPSNVKKETRPTTRYCERCFNPENESATPYMQCKVCRDIDRRTTYCSKKCQKDDWPRHKLICGKKLTLETAASTAMPVKNPSNQQVEPSAGGYKRSLALASQVHLLNHGPNYDYFFIKSDGSRGLAPFTAPGPVKSVFREMRNKAFITGDRRSAAALGELLVYLCDQVSRHPSLTREGVLEQLVLEFGASIKNDIHTLEVISFQGPFPHRIQFQKLMKGGQIYDVSILPPKWETIQAEFDIAASSKNAKYIAWSSVPEFLYPDL